MISLDARITLLSDVALTSRSATLGGQRTLWRIPGAVIRGALAANGGYAAAATRSFSIFHAGSVRFGDAHLIADGLIAWPAPLSLHAEKRQPEADAWNLAVADRPDAQLEQVRERLVLPSGDVTSPRRSYSMRTAVGDGGRARDGFLFGVDALTRGQEFVARIDADEEADLRWVRERLAGATLDIGRSRTAEFGRVRVEVAETALTRPSPAVTRAVLWCVSDIALRDPETGAALLFPTGAALGLSGWQVDETRSFLRFRRYSPFNAQWRRPAVAREVIAAGSVFTVSGPALDVDAALAKGVGEYREDGLGRIVTSVLLAKGRLALPLYEPSDAATPRLKPAVPQSPDATWLGARIADSERERRTAELARRHAAEIRWFKVPSAQWGTLRSVALTSAWAGHLDHLASGKGAAAQAWTRVRGGKTAGQALRDLVCAQPNDLQADFLVQLASRMSKEA